MDPHHKPHASFIDLHARAFDDVREITGTTRPDSKHASPVTEVIPGLYIARGDDVKDPCSFNNISLSRPIGLVVNANAQNPTQTGYYGPDLEVLFIPVEDHPEPGDAKQYFPKVNAKIKDTLKFGMSVLVHCGGSISRATTFVIAYLMEAKYLSTYEATALLKSKWPSTFPNDSFVRQLLAWEADLIADVRAVTGMKRPPGTHGCKLVQILPGLFNAHFNDIDKPDSFEKLNLSPPIGLVVNSAVANKQCDTYPGFYGPNIEVLCIDLFDDPKENEAHKWPGDSKPSFRSTNAKIRDTIAAGKGVMVHCMASLSRSIVLLAAYLMETQGMSTIEALTKIKGMWDATWPNDHFVRELKAFEEELRA